MTARLDVDWANVVVHTGLAFTPEQYRSLTVRQRAALKSEALKKEG